MKIETKFNVNDLVQHKFARGGKNRVHALEVVEVQTQTCYTESQVFYKCRSINAEFDKYKIESDGEWIVGYDMGKGDGYAGYKTCREDELIEASEETKKIIKGEK